MFTLRPHQNDILDALVGATKGIVQCPTGGGKTYAFITDSRRFMFPGKVIVVVAPTKVLSGQLFREFDTHLRDVNFMWRQVSSEAKAYQRDRSGLKFRVVPPLFPTTSPNDIADTYRIAVKAQKPLILFSTYASLGKIVSAGIPIEVVYYDEAHNATDSDNFPSVEKLSTSIAKYNYFFTATPKISRSGRGNSSGMDKVDVYGEIICKVDYNVLREQGIVLLPKLRLLKTTADATSMNKDSINIKTIKELINKFESTNKINKIIVCANGTKSISAIINNPALVGWMRELGYDVLSIDSINDGYINGGVIKSKDQFISILNDMGKDVDRKMIVFHHSMLSEGIDVKAFNELVFLRNSMDEIFTTQAIGRVIRSCPGKEYGGVTVVEHESDTEQAKDMVRFVVDSLIHAGVPPEAFIGEQDGRADDEEVVEDLPSEYATFAKNIAIDFQYSTMMSNALSKLLGMDTVGDEFAF